MEHNLTSDSQHIYLIINKSLWGRGWGDFLPGNIYNLMGWAGTDSLHGILYQFYE